MSGFSAPVTRYVVVAGVVGLWMLLGYLLRTEPNTYLLLGVPLLWAFQRFIARRPVAELWFAEPPRFVLPWWGIAVAIAFMIAPVHAIATWKNPGWPVRLWLVCAACGAWPLAWSLTRITRSQWRDLVLCVAITGAIASISLVAQVIRRPPSDIVWTTRAVEGLTSFIRYLPVCFMIEEVFFRGGLDTYLTRGDPRRRWFSAIFVSTVWGWWHLPIVPLQGEHRLAQLGALIVLLPLVHSAVGVWLSLFWRRSGLLLVPVAAHAFIDAMRNAMSLQ